MPNLRDLITAVALTLPSVCPIAWAQGPNVIEDLPDLGSAFDAAGTEGTFVIVNVSTNEARVYNPARAAKSFPPASTFKIFNSLIALDTGVVTDTDTQVLKWDGQTRPIAAWNKDHTLRSAFAASAFPAYQGVARQVGLERMQGYLTAIPYGAGDISSETLDVFWVMRGYTITAWQQVDFLKRLYLNDLPFPQRVLDAVKDIAVVERGDSYVLSGKTGWTVDRDPGMGWFVGWLARGDDAYVFATNLDIFSQTQADARLGITRQALESLGLLS